MSADPQPLPLFDRELSWLEFNRRVLAEAESESVPLLERLKFLSICASNLDEFFMIRIGEIRDTAAMNVRAETPGPRDRLDAVRGRTRELLDRMYRSLADTLLPELRGHGIRIERAASLGKKEAAFVAEYFARELEPILTPLALDPGHPFPLLANLALNLAIFLESERAESYPVVLRIPESMPRFIRLPDARRYVPIEDVIASHASRLFPGLKVRRTIPFRVIRNSDLAIKEDDVQDLMQSVETELRRRERSEVVWMEVEGEAAAALMNMIMEATGLGETDVFVAGGPLRLRDLMQVYRENPEAELLDPPFNPRIPSELASAEDIFSIIRRGDILLHRPYDSFGSVIEFVQAAAEDPDVLAIKQTLYRTDPGSPIVEALSNAAERGKQVTAVVELQARFDEKKNITWARHLEHAGVQVVYGLVGIKTHCKMCLVVRREGRSLRRYLHLSTGNYNAVTGRLYTDIDLFTCDPDFGADAAHLMNVLTGFSVAGMQELIASKKKVFAWRRLVVSPMDYQQWVLGMIEREIAHAAEGKPASIMAKMNALVDPAVIRALYRASNAGVKIDLLVRGACCLVPQLKGYSENIRVLSVIDRFLEHARIFRFENGGAAEVYVSSGDWMPRNFIRRIEATFPILDPELCGRIEKQILPISLSDNVKAWALASDGAWRRLVPGDEPHRSQETFIRIARAEAVRLGPYDEILRRPGSARRKAKKKKKHH
ncbi:MAG TPA: polyphosphate kinase 1 [Thermoanaerobaculia bacterium]|nr:polyphosphate kinase 1 [Thermoanaerobaculia bacterium]